jgi:hypothetical protein
LMASMTGVGSPPSASCSTARPASRNACSRAGSGRCVAPTLSRAAVRWCSAASRPRYPLRMGSSPARARARLVRRCRSQLPGTGRCPAPADRPTPRRCPADPRPVRPCWPGTPARTSRRCRRTPLMVTSCSPLVTSSLSVSLPERVVPIAGGNVLNDRLVHQLMRAAAQEFPARRRLM